MLMSTSDRFQVTPQFRRRDLSAACRKPEKTGLLSCIRLFQS